MTTWRGPAIFAAAGMPGRLRGHGGSVARTAMFRGDMQHTGAYHGRIPKGLRGVKWRVDGGTILKAPVAAGGLVIAASLEHGATRNYGFLRAFEAATGSPRWVFDGKAGLGVPGGIPNTAAVSAGLVLFGSGGGQFSAVALASGQLAWEFKTGGAILSSPTVRGGTVYFGSADSMAYALDVRSGRLRWRYAAGARIHAPLALDGKLVYLAGEDGSIHALSIEGELLWREVLPHAQPISLAVSRGFVFVSDASEGSLRVVAASARRLVWMFHVGGHAAAVPAVSSGVVCVSGGGRLVGLDIASGQTLWRLEAGGDTAAPVIVRSTAVVAGRDGKIRAVDLATGTELWTWDAGERVLSEILIDGGVVYFGGSRDTLVALE